MTFSSELQRRIEVTASVRDTDELPKVPSAGQVEERDGKRVQVMHNGVVVEEDGYGGAWMTELIRRLHGHHEPQEEVAFNAIVERIKADTPEPTMIELGSFWAYYSLWFKHTTGGRCVCVEPDPNNLEVGRRNFAFNGFDAHFIQAAVGEPHGHDIKMRTESDNQLRQLSVVTLEGLMRDEKIDRVDLLLSDIQGFEQQLLTNSQQLLRDGRVRFLVVSTHHHTISGDPLTHQRCRDLLRDAGAHLIAEHSVLESASGDGLIVASMNPRDRDMQVDVTHLRAKDSIFGEPEYEIAQAGRIATRQLRNRIGRRVQRALSRF